MRRLSNFLFLVVFVGGWWFQKGLDRWRAR